MSQYSGIEKRLNELTSAVKALDKTSGRSSEKALSRIPFDVSALTTEEVASLGQLIKHEDDICGYSASQIAVGGDKIRGMYTEFKKLGLVATDLNGQCIAVLPMAHWAVEKHEQMPRDAKSERNSQWRHDVIVASVSTAIGGVLGIAGTLLGTVLS